MEGLRQREVVVEHPFTDTGEAARKKAKSVMDKIIQGLTQPLTAEEKRTGVVEPPRPPTVAVQGSLEEVQEYFSKRYWTDGLPIIPPTEEAVKKC